jgi:glycosyltransferase involved in cell wall biosynthesis
MLAGAIVRVLKDKALRDRMGAAGLARVSEHFGVSRLLTGTLRAYRRAASLPHVDAGDRPTSTSV